MFAYKFSMNTAREISRCILRYRWVNRSNDRRQTEPAVLGHIEAGDRFDDFRTRDCAGCRSQHCIFYPCTSHACMLWHAEAYSARRPWNQLRPKTNRSFGICRYLFLVHLKVHISNTSIIIVSLPFLFYYIVSFRYALFFIPLESFFRTWERAFSTSWLSVHR